ncbi:MAG: hypothetical protein ACRYHQ_07120 [Janthinobacterium lividum]
MQQRSLLGELAGGPVHGVVEFAVGSQARPFALKDRGPVGGELGLFCWCHGWFRIVACCFAA